MFAALYCAGVSLMTSRESLLTASVLSSDFGAQAFITTMMLIAAIRFLMLFTSIKIVYCYQALIVLMQCIEIAFAYIECLPEVQEQGCIIELTTIKGFPALTCEQVSGGQR